MLTSLVLFGATGDLASRLLLPALVELEHEGALDELRIICSSVEDGDDEWFREHASQQLEEFASELAPDARERLVQRISYVPADVTASDSVNEVISAVQENSDEPIACYLALPPSVMTEALQALASADLPEGSRIAMEKPFGEDLNGAKELGGLLKKLFADPDRTVFNVDHALGMEPLQAMFDLRANNPFPEAVWSSGHIEEIAVLWEETMALEGRAEFYDNTGALKDVMQNHMMQVLITSIIDLPSFASDGGVDTKELHQLKVDLLKSAHVLRTDDPTQRSNRGRYTAGTLTDDADGQGRSVPDFVDEDGVSEERGTETYAEVLLEVDSPRWKGTTFRLRAGKALSARRKGLEVTFRKTGRADAGSQLWLGIDGPFDASFSLDAGLNAGGSKGGPRSLDLAGEQPESHLSPYANVLADFLSDGQKLAAGAAESELAWRVLTPVLEDWAQGKVPMQDYAAGSDGPARIDIASEEK